MGTTMQAPRGRRRRGALVVALGAITVVAAGCIPVGPPPPPPPTVIVYGDSLMVESRGVVGRELEALRPGYRVLTTGRSFGGIALCDALDDMQADANENARLVVVQFSGNVSGCVGSAAASIARYTADAEATVQIWAARGVPVLFVGSPSLIVDGPSQARNPIDVAFETVAAAHPGQAFFDGTPPEALSVEDPTMPPDGSLPHWRFFPYEMDCLRPDEPYCDPSTLKVAVRWLPAGSPPPWENGNGHLCTTHQIPIGPDFTCPEYRSGVERFGRAIAVAAAAHLT